MYVCVVRVYLERRVLLKRNRRILERIEAYASLNVHYGLSTAATLNSKLASCDLRRSKASKTIKRRTSQTTTICGTQGGSRLRACFHANHS